eukprot:jgi/Botrbrau1/13527/Bobra.0347s0011.1
MERTVETSAPPCAPMHKRVLWQDLGDEEDDSECDSQSKPKSNEDTGVQRRIDSVYLAKKRLQVKQSTSDRLSSDYDDRSSFDGQEDDEESITPVSQSRCPSRGSDKSSKSCTSQSKGVVANIKSLGRAIGTKIKPHTVSSPEDGAAQEQIDLSEIQDSGVSVHVKFREAINIVD